VRSTPGTGSVFTMTLPLCPPGGGLLVTPTGLPSVTP